MNKRKEIPILLTSSVIAHDKGVKLLDKGERIHQTLLSVQQWKEVSPDSPIVICDGSDYDFTNDLQKIISNPTNIECLHFNNNPMDVEKYGRGFGEGEIIKHAIESSKFINDFECFAKCSAKLWVKNFPNIYLKWNGIFQCKGVFKNIFSISKSIELDYIDTRFYLTSLRFYKQFLVNAHLNVRKTDEQGLENQFLNHLISSNQKSILFSIPPIIEGVGGGTGIPYKTTKLRHLKEILKINRSKKKFSALYE